MFIPFVLASRDTLPVTINFRYPILQKSLRSNLKGFQYYVCAYESRVSGKNIPQNFIEFNFIYSSACPCSAELAEHAREFRSTYGVPHSQRSVAKIRVKLVDGKSLFVEDLHRIALAALQTETQVMVKREDEQAFAEMNGSHLKFVEDAVRLLHQELNKEKNIADFTVYCSHLESLHTHDAVASISKGIKNGMKADSMDFQLLRNI